MAYKIIYPQLKKSREDKKESATGSGIEEKPMMLEVLIAVRRTMGKDDATILSELRAKGYDYEDITAALQAISAPSKATAQSKK